MKPSELTATLRSYGTLLLLAWAVTATGLAVWSYVSGQLAMTELNATRKAHEQMYKALDARDAARQKQLDGELAEIERLKREVTKPREIVRQIPQYVPLPEAPLYIPPSVQPNLAQPDLAAQQESPPGSTPPVAELPLRGATVLPEGMFVPAKDLPALWSYIQDCRACDAKLRSAEAGLRIEKERRVLIEQERDVAIKAAKGGGFWKRLRSGLKWFGAGGSTVAVLILLL